MSKSIKLKNDTYIDGSAIRINRKTILDYIYPIGSIYMSVNSTSPETLFGGVWERLQDRFLVGAGDLYTAGNTGGKSMHQHPYKIGFRPYYGALTGNDTDAIMLYNYQNNSWTSGTRDNSIPESKVINRGLTTSSNKTGSSKYSIEAYTENAFNIPPYLAVYMWKRTE